MTSVYNLLREACGISQAEAADYVHETRLDTVKSWCSERRPVPPGAIEELKQLARQIIHTAEAYAEQIQRRCVDGVVIIGLPHDEKDARSCGFPSLGAYMRMVAIAIARLPEQLQILTVPRVKATPAAVLEPELPRQNARAGAPAETKKARGAP